MLPLYHDDDAARGRWRIEYSLCDSNYECQEPIAKVIEIAYPCRDIYMQVSEPFLTGLFVVGYDEMNEYYNQPNFPFNDYFEPKYGEFHTEAVE